MPEVSAKAPASTGERELRAGETLEKLLAENIDHVRSVGGLEPAGRVLLLLCALRFFAAANARTPKDDVWCRIHDSRTRNLVAVPVAQELLQKLAVIVEDRHPELGGVFSAHLTPALTSVSTQLLTWMTILEPLGSALASNTAAFAGWFDRVVDDIASRGAAGLQFVTPRWLALLMVDLADLQPGESIHDPCAGTASLLSAAYFRCLGKAPGIDVSAQEANTAIAALARLRLYLLAGDSSRVRVGDALREPVFVRDGKLEMFDVVLCDPPLGQKVASTDFIQHNRYERFPYGPPDRTSSEFAFLQHGVACLKRRGRAVALIAHGPLFRGGRDAAVRMAMIQDDLFEAVIGLPYGSLPGLPIEPALVICRRRKAENQKGSVLFIDASDRRDAVKSPDAWGRLAADILSSCNGRKNVRGFSRSVPMKEIAESEYSLQPRRYVVREKHSKAVDVTAALDEAAACEREAVERAADMDRLVAKINAEK